MQVRLVRAVFEPFPVRTRLPFRFGAVTLTEGVRLRARVEIDGDAGVAEGRAEDLLVPKWFDKNPATTVGEDRAALREAAESAGRQLQAAGTGTPFALWRAVYRQWIEPLEFHEPQRMVRGFGLALIERALLDAVCAAAGVGFGEAWRRDLPGFAPGEMHRQLAGWNAASSLPATPAATLAVRHTVGMLDPLRVEDIDARDRVDDGMPQALAEDVDAYGLRWFKIKVGQGPEADAARLLDLARFFAERAERPRFSLDGNEQYDDLAGLAQMLRLVRAETEGARFLEGLAFIEQPLHRRATFDPERHRAMAEVVELGAPLILDEADTGIDAFPMALELGYRGVSVKNCKGVFRAMANRGICELHDGAFQSAEDLTNLPVVALQQDLCTMSTLGFEHVERNGHHYFRGLDHLGADERDAALRAHPGLYRRNPDGGAALRIEGGELAVASLHGAGYGR